MIHIQSSPDPDEQFVVVKGRTDRQRFILGGIIPSHTTVPIAESHVRSDGAGPAIGRCCHNLTTIAKIILLPGVGGAILETIKEHSSRCDSHLFGAARV
jgi:hypothetical protein